MPAANQLDDAAQEEAWWRDAFRDLAAKRRARDDHAKADEWDRLASEPAPVTPDRARRRKRSASDPDGPCALSLGTMLTRREYRGFKKHLCSLEPRPTRSTFLRFIICEFLEARRRKDCPTRSFRLNLADIAGRQTQT